MSVGPSTASATQLTLPGFSGTLDAFLQLVAQHKLSPEDVPVAEVTRQFRARVDSDDAVDLELAGELMAASSRLMVLKSSHLLLEHSSEGADDEETQSVDVSGLRAFQVGLDMLRLREGAESMTACSRPLLVTQRYEPRPVRQLTQAWTWIADRSQAQQVRVTVPSFVKLEVAVSSLMRRLRGGLVARFTEVVHRQSRGDTVTHFLALLELLRSGRVRADQDALFGEIQMEWNKQDVDSSSRAG